MRTCGAILVLYLIMAPAIAGAVSPQTPMTDALSFGGGQNAAGAGDEAQMAADFVGQMRDAAQPLIQLLSTDPLLAQEAEALKTLLKQALMKKAQAAMLQTASSQAVPMSGGLG